MDKAEQPKADQLGAEETEKTTVVEPSSTEFALNRGELSESDAELALRKSKLEKAE